MFSRISEAEITSFATSGAFDDYVFRAGGSNTIGKLKDETVNCKENKKKDKHKGR